eukprot:s739_g5.t1
MAHRTLITEPYRVADPFTSVRTCEHSDTLTIARQELGRSRRVDRTHSAWREEVKNKGNEASFFGTFEVVPTLAYRRLCTRNLARHASPKVTCRRKDPFKASHLTNIDQLLLAQFWPRVKICSSFHLLHRSLSLLWADFRGEENGLAGPLPSPSFQAIKIN